MKTMKKAALVAMLLGCAAWAQDQPVVTQVEGLVTVGQGADVGLLQPGARLVDGTRIVTGSSGKAEIQVSAECTLTINPNQVFTFEDGKGCRELFALIHDVAPAANRTMFAALMSSDTGMMAAIGGAALVGATALDRNSRSTPISGQ